VILRSIHVEHWCCIAELDLPDLPPEGIVVLHGPNRTGKSSLVKALRGCLFDLDHDTTKAEFKNCLPYNGAGPPKIVVEFETGGERYRLSKVFSKRADGLSRLEKKSGSNWFDVGDSSKEAARKTRELLGAYKSDQGFNQLLWLNQGIVFLPDEKELDASLERRLVGVLGVMVTSRDLAFKEILDNRCATWFGARGSHKPTSPVSVWHSRLEERKTKLAEERERFREVERTIEELTECERQIPVCEKSIEDANSELTKLLSEQARCEERRAQYENARQAHQAAIEGVEFTQKQLAAQHDAKALWEKAKELRDRTEAQLLIHRQEKERIEKEYGQRRDELDAARSAEEEHQLTREEIEDRAKFVSLEEQTKRLEAELKRAREAHATMERFHEQIQENAALDKRVLEGLRENREQARELRARIQAEALDLRITLKRSDSLEVRLDSEPTQKVSLTSEQERTWFIHEQAAIHLPNVASIEIARRKTRDLERSAQKIATLDREYHDTVRAFGEEPSDEQCLNRLTERRVARELAIGKVDAAKTELAQVAPRGLRDLEGARNHIENQRKAVLERRPDLAGWQPHADEVTERIRQFRIRANSLQQTRKEIEQAVKRSESDLKAANKRLWDCNEQTIAARTSAENSFEQLNRLDDEVVLAARLKEAQSALSEAGRLLREAELTEEEKTIGDRCQRARSALEARQERLAHIRLDLAAHRGRLEGSEGLQSRLADAEAAVIEAEKALARESAEADAHKRLRDLFDECRDNQVQRVMGPIADRVLGWARSIGLQDYHGFRFGDRFLPEGMLLANGDGDVPRSLREESYGTSEQLSLLIRLALGGILANDESQVAILDDPLAHADAAKHRLILDIVRLASEGNRGWNPPAGKLQIIVLTCHPDRFDYLTSAKHIDLAKLITREPLNQG
jgi:DNA repair exonuclease SbcCD ATPase subunit